MTTGDIETTKIDNVMKKVEAQIEKLQEYRQVLITSAVTGKIRVDIRLANIN
ncbi:hypothetical protein HY339_00460 [Candidatus Gottesmanbacteria bacterium]|nr:hypothetical protein [Candidatus Gottesmanbacteria bacterium]